MQHGTDVSVGAVSGRRRRRRRARRSTPGCVRWWRGISIRPAVVRSGSTTRRSLDGIRDAKFRASRTSVRLGPFEDEWLRGGPVQRWVPRGPRGQTHLRLRDRRHDRCAEDADRLRRLSHGLRALQPHAARRALPAGIELADARSFRSASSAPGGRTPCAVSRRHQLLRRPRSALGHQADQEGLDRAPAGLQGPRHRSGRHDPRRQSRHQAACSRRRSCSSRWRSGSSRWASSIRKAGITGIFSGGTEFTPQWNRFAHEELLDGAYMTPTYGNTLMGLAASAPTGPETGYKITYHAPQPRAVLEVVDFDDPTKLVGYGETGRVRLTTLTREFFMPGFLERDEGEREPPHEKYPVGRRQRRAALSAGFASHDDGRSVLMLAEPELSEASNPESKCLSRSIPSWGRRTPAWTWTRSRISRPASRWRGSVARTADCCNATCARPTRRARRSARFRSTTLIARVGQGRRGLHARHAADGRRIADARRVRARPVGDDRTARAHVPREHEEERVRARAHARHPDVADARVCRSTS